jgi:peptidyl-prolyl cis-trans isomerase NIMA-interacting 1
MLNEDEGPRRIDAQHLVVMYRNSQGAPPTIVRSRAEARKRAEEALQKIHGGADIDQVIAEYSDEPGAANRTGGAGNLGTISRKSVVKRFARVAFSLAIDEVSDVIETEFGFHIIRRTK